MGRFLSVDPLSGSYPYYTPYQFAGNKPVMAIDLDGLEDAVVNVWGSWWNDRIVEYLQVNDYKSVLAVILNGSFQTSKKDLSVKGQQWANRDWGININTPLTFDAVCSISDFNNLIETQKRISLRLDVPRNNGTTYMTQLAISRIKRGYKNADLSPSQYAAMKFVFEFTPFGALASTTFKHDAKTGKKMSNTDRIMKGAEAGLSFVTLPNEFKNAILDYGIYISSDIIFEETFDRETADAATVALYDIGKNAIKGDVKNTILEMLKHGVINKDLLLSTSSNDGYNEIKEILDNVKVEEVQIETSYPSLTRDTDGN